MNNTLFDCEHTAEHPRFISHRGYTPIAPENSLVSFKEAGKRGVWAIETDVHLTADGRLVCCHDSSAARMYGEDCIIEETEFGRLALLRICSGNRVETYDENQLKMPGFDEYLDICSSYGAIPFIETKGSDAVVEKVVAVLKKRDIIEKTVLSSVDFSHIQAARRMSGKLFVHHIFSSETHMRELSEMGNAGLSYNYPNLAELPAGLIEKTHCAGVKVCLRAGDNPDTVKKMMELGLDYIPTNTMYGHMK